MLYIQLPAQHPNAPIVSMTNIPVLPKFISICPCRASAEYAVYAHIVVDVIDVVVVAEEEEKNRIFRSKFSPFQTILIFQFFYLFGGVRRERGGGKKEKKQ